jgi:ABC-type siderophore export system fused ATPase/permease subunit
MTKTITLLTYALVNLAIAVILWMDISGYKTINSLNFTLLIIFGIFTSIIVGEILFNKVYDKEENNDI